MARVELHFDTGEAMGDGKVFVDGEEITKIRFINLFASYEHPTRLIISRICEDSNNKPVKVKDEKGEGFFLEETFDVFKTLKVKNLQTNAE